MTISTELTLSELQAAFVKWRQTRRPRTVPTPLRLNTLALLGQHPTGEILQTLGINHSMLRRWKAQYATPSSSAFVELPKLATPVVTPCSEPLNVAVPTPAQPLALTIRREVGTLTLSGALSLAQWRLALSLLT